MRLFLARSRIWPCGQRKAARKPAEQSHARRLDSHKSPTAPRPSSPARSNSGRASSPPSRKSPPRRLDLPLARVRMISGDTGQTPNEGQTAGSQSIENSGTALRMACAEAARHFARPRGEAARRGSGQVQGRRRRYRRRLTAARSATASCRRRRSQSRSDGQGRRRSRPRATRSSENPIARFDIPAKVTGGAAYVQDMRPAGHAARSRGAAAALRLEARQRRRSRRESDAGRDRGGARRLFPRRRRRARGAGDQGARSAAPKREMDARDPSCRIPRRIFEHAQVAAEQAMPPSASSRAPCPPAPAPSRRPTPSLTWRTARSVRPARSPSSRTARMTVWTHSQGVFPLRARTGQGR